MERIRLDFRRTREDIVKALSKFYPDINDKMLEKLENE